MSIGKHIREYRKKAGLTQKELAEKSNIAEITIRQYESGKRTPNSEKLKNIANVLQISPSLLMGIDSSKFDKQINLAEVQQELSKDTYIKNYFQTLGFTITTNVTKWHWENDSKEHQIVDQLEYILSKDNDSIAISVQEFEELQLRTKEVIEGVFYKKLIQEKELIIDNIIYLTGQPGDVLSSNLSLTERVIIMSTYEELQIILTTALLIVAILTYTHKK